MTILYEEPPVGSREISIGIDNLNTMAKAFAAGLQTKKGPIDITKAVEEQPMEKLGTEQTIQPFSPEVPTADFNQLAMADVPQPNLDTKSLVTDPTQQSTPLNNPQPVQPGAMELNNQNPVAPSEPTIQPAAPSEPTIQPVVVNSQQQQVASQQPPKETNIFDSPTSVDETKIPEVIPSTTNQANSLINDATIVQPTPPSQVETAPSAPVETVSERVPEQPINGGTSSEHPTDNSEVNNAASDQLAKPVEATNNEVNSAISPLIKGEIISCVLAKDNETVYDLSNRTGVPVELLSSINSLTDTNIKAGQIIYLPQGVKGVYKYEVQLYGGISNRITMMINNEADREKPYDELNGIGEGSFTK